MPILCEVEPGRERQLNSTIHTIMQSRLRDPETKA